MHNIIHNVHVKVPPCMQSHVWHGHGCSGCFTGCIDCPPSGWSRDGWPWPYCYRDNYYRHWDFSGPGPQFPGHLISLVLGWPCGLTSPVSSKSFNVVWAILHDMLRFRAIFLNESSIAIRCRWLSNKGQPNTLTCVLIQQTSWPSWCLQIWTDHILPRGASWIMTGFCPTSDILPQEADHEHCYDLRCASTDTSVWSGLKSTVLISEHRREL